MLIKDNENGFMGNEEEEDNWEMVIEDESLSSSPMMEGAQDQPPSSSMVETTTTTNEPEEDDELQTAPVQDMVEGTSTDQKDGAEQVLVDEEMTATEESTPLLLNIQNNNGVSGEEHNEAADNVPRDNSSSSSSNNNADDDSCPNTNNTSSSENNTSGVRSPLLDKTVLEERLRVAKRKIKNTVKDIDENAHKIQETAVSGLKEVGETAKVLGATLRQDIDEHAHKLQATTVSGLKQAGASVKSLGETLRQETETVSGTVKRVYVEQDVEQKAKVAAEQVKRTATTVGREAKKFNDKYGVTDKIASAAIFVGALALARGNNRNGVAAMAVAGTSFMAGEAMRSPATAQSSTELNENLHMD